MQKYRVSLDDIEQTKNLAIFFANKVNKGSVILLKGDLGSGKTTFAQFFIYEICGIKDVVTSPTFNLVHQYKSVNFDLWHFDLYRLKNIEEVFELGLEDALKYGVALIEWPELIEDVLKVSNKVTINFQNSSNNRIAEVTTEGVFCKNK
ncbi:MAG: tRNA (adenosine(37)-N6)-threonylcarbamoyltransferase complex ATPase subunit type 1 TsaE [Alphaproteobacteria bacterium]|jgi:tRNA threonylcarbamoyladenosine biosynthesis protein TsaE